MLSPLRKLERALRRIHHTRRHEIHVEISTALLKAALELAIFAMLLYLTGEILTVAWRLAQSFTSALIPPG